MKSVVICGSGRFKTEVIKFSTELRKLGVVVFEPPFPLREPKLIKEFQSLSETYKEKVVAGLTFDHFQKIRNADVVYVFNKDGYCGNSTTQEIGYAVALGKPVYALSDKDEEYARKILFREIIKTPKELLKKLK